MNITQFTMEEVRCFAGHQEFKIRPLTFLVGENSTGKTTALGCFQVLANYLGGESVHFNSDPYSMGVFRDIVRNSKKEEKAFELGFTFGGENENLDFVVEFAKKKGGFEPIVKSITIKFIDGEMVLRRFDDITEWLRDVPVKKVGATTWREVPNMRLASFNKGRNQYCVDMYADFLDRTPFPFLSNRFSHGGEGEDALVSFLGKKEKDIGIPWWQIGERIAVFSAAPIRSRPKRTYDPTREFYDPEGSHVPMQLMRMQATERGRWEGLKEQLIEFGKRSGMFQNIDVKNLGGSMGNPFQLKVKVRGPNSNIVDVGYGVSQILPILVNSLDPPIRRGPLMEKPFFLLQQPEVHLHPRAQAELSSLLAMSSQFRLGCIVETHSDYMIDRARIEIRKGNIRPEDVSLIYLEPKRNVVKVHNISFDKMGNMEGVPQHYRDFFMTEYRRLMGFED
ncbi:AAA family ATPase [Candidatus Poribacteria bacterium]|nr:AAA family ATPase [Candidatus Poribacteria bacterium]